MRRWLIALAVALGLGMAQGYALVEATTNGAYRLYLTYDFLIGGFILSPYTEGRYGPSGYDLEAGLELYAQDWRLGVAWSARYGLIARSVWIARFGR